MGIVEKSYSDIGTISAPRTQVTAQDVSLEQVSSPQSPAIN